jgi:fructuronate reductase
MQAKVLNQQLLADQAFWQGKRVLLPAYDRLSIPIKSLAFSAGRMAYGHTGDILQDLLNRDPTTGMMAGIETFALRYVTELSAADYLMTQLIYEDEKGRATPKIQGAIKTVLMVDANVQSLTWQRMLEFARDPGLQFATINAPEGAYGVAYTGAEFAEPISAHVKQDLTQGTVTSDPGKWTAFARERFQAGLPFALVSCTNFSGNGYVTGATLRMMARAWETHGFAPPGFVAYLSDPTRFSFPNTMIDRIAVAPDTSALGVLEELGVVSNLVVTEKVRYWAVEDLFPAGRPDFDQAEGVFLCADHREVKRYEEMKLRILNMSHSTLAGLGVLLGYRGPYGIYRAMQDPDLGRIIESIVDIVIGVVERPERLDPRNFARDSKRRLNNPNIPDDPMRIALNGSTKMKPRFLDSYFAGRARGLTETELEVLLWPVAGFLRYCLGSDDQGISYALEDDPLKQELMACSSRARLGDPASAAAFRPLIADPRIMGVDLYQAGSTGSTLERLVRRMLEGHGAVRRLLEQAPFAQATVRSA